jgi:uncharacterized protein (DUF2384 family)
MTTMAAQQFDPESDDGDKSRWLNFRELYHTTPVDRIDLIRSGVNAADFKNFVSRLDIQQEKECWTLPPPPSTARPAAMNRCRAKTAKKSSAWPNSSARSKRCWRNRAIPLMQDFDATRWLTHWMEEPIPALGGASPADYMDTIEGQEMISRLLATMQTGAYA